jgi:hypothetical protein
LRRIAIAAICSLFVIAVETHADERRDGNWWRGVPPEQRSAYVLGLLDGTHLGHEFSYWRSVESGKLLEFQRLDSFAQYADKYLSKVRSDQLSDGLDTFYDDYRNRGIKVRDATWLVLNAIAGTPAASLQKTIESYRRHAHGN